MTLPGLSMSDWQAPAIPPRRRRASRSGEYTGAVIDRLQSFLTGLKSEDQELKGNLEQLRAHSRDLARNNVWMRRFFRLVGHQVVGAKGVTLQSGIRMADGRPKVAANDAIEAAWREWCRPGTPCVDGRMSWTDMQRHSIRGAARDGELFWRKIRGTAAGNRFGFALQPLDPDLLDVNHEVPGSATRNAVVMGVEIDQYNRPVAFHFWSCHPNDHRRERTKIRVPARDIVHFYDPNRVNQTRGVPWSAAATWMLAMLGAYTEAEIAAARAESERQGFLINELGDAAPAPETGSAAHPLPVEIPSESTSWWEIPGGYKPELPDVRHPTTAFASFVTEMLRGIATGLNVSYHSLTGDLTGANYSSLRQGALDEREAWRECQQLLIDHFCQPVFEEWLDMAVISGALNIAARDLEPARFPSWEPRGWDWVDPLKDSKASIMDVEAGFDSRTRICAERGRNFEDILRQLAEEKRLAEQYGVDLGTVKDPTVAEQDVTDGQATTAGGKKNAAA